MNLRLPKSSLGSFSLGVKTRTIPNLSGSKALRSSASFKLPKLDSDVALSGNYRKAIERSSVPTKIRTEVVKSTDAIYMGGNTKTQFASAVNASNHAMKNLLTSRQQRHYFPKGRVR